MAEGKAGSSKDTRQSKPIQPANPSLRRIHTFQPHKVSCPECGSKRIWKDGLRYPHSKGKPIQRYLCRECNYRFSETSQNKNSDSFQHSEHDQKIDTLILKTLGGLSYTCQVGVRRQGGSKNLAEVESRVEKRAAGATETKQTKADIKGKLVEYIWRLKKEGYAETTIKTYGNILSILVKRGASLYDPERVKEVIARQDTWSPARKNNVVKAYNLFLKMVGLSWQPPKYKQPRKLPFIPTEKELNDLIAGCSRKMSAYLQLLKETGVRRGEAYQLKWTDIDPINRTVRITPEKGSNPRIFRISENLARKLGSLPKNSLRVFDYLSPDSLSKSYRKQRKRIAHKLGNPRLQRISFHTFRHWKATMEYYRTKDILHVMQMLGHRKIDTTLIYVQLVKAIFKEVDEQYICKVAKNAEEAKQLIELGFEYVTGEYHDGGKLFRKKKLLYLRPADE